MNTPCLQQMEVDEKKLHIQVKTLQEQEPSLRMQLKIQENVVADSASNPKKVEQSQKAMNSAKECLEEVKKISKSVEMK